MPAEWDRLASLEYLESFDRQVPSDEYFEVLIVNVRTDLVNLQKHIKTVESAKRNEWIRELIQLKKNGYEANFDRISELEKNLNDLSE
ncbi:MAG: hypothetical protein ACK55I_15585, partial [bacterium]